MDIKERFNDVFRYAFSAEAWVKSYFASIGFECDHTFVSDLCIADWLGNDSAVIDTYKKFVKEWGEDYKTFTEIVMCINLLSWFNNKLIDEGIEGREKWVDFYGDLYYTARGSFYEKFRNNEEACDWFFNCTD